MKFTGECQDPAGLYHLRARQYDPELGRFTKTDPYLSSAWDPYVSSYVYVNNRPTVGVDPSGLCFLWLSYNDDGSCKGKEIAYGTRDVVTAPFTVAGSAIGEASGTCNFDGSKVTIVCTSVDDVPGAPALTLGSTVLGEINEFDAKLLQHEYAHVDQWSMGRCFRSSTEWAKACRSSAATVPARTTLNWAGFEAGNYEC